MGFLTMRVNRQGGSRDPYDSPEVFPRSEQTKQLGDRCVEGLFERELLGHNPGIVMSWEKGTAVHIYSAVERANARIRCGIPCLDERSLKFAYVGYDRFRMQADGRSPGHDDTPCGSARRLQLMS